MANPKGANKYRLFDSEPSRGKPGPVARVVWECRKCGAVFDSANGGVLPSYQKHTLTCVACHGEPKRG